MIRYAHYQSLVSSHQSSALDILTGNWRLATGKSYKVVRIMPVRRGGELLLSVSRYTYPVIRPWQPEVA